MKRRVFLTPMLFALAVLLPVLGHGQSGNDPDPYGEITGDTAEFDFDETLIDPWIENETELPALPEQSKMREIELDALPSGFAFYVDREGLTVDPRDRVVRLWTWTVSSAGTKRGTFEGFRCETGEYKIYAYASPKREPPVREVKRPRWRPVQGKGATVYRTELMKDYFCSIGSVNPTEQQIKTAIVQGPTRDKLLFSD